MYITILATLSRPECIPIVMDNLAVIFLNEGHVFEVVIAIDNKEINEINLGRALPKLDARNVTIFNTKNKPPKKMDMEERRTRIAKLHNAAKSHIGGSNFVFGFEDDTILPPLALRSLLKVWNEQQNPGVVQGVEVGRWGHPYIGAWYVDDIHNPQEYQTALAKSPVQEIDAGGLYCFLTSTAIYKSITHRWQEPVGPDVDFGLQLRRQGYNNYMCWNVVCGHQTTAGKVLIPTDLAQITFNKDKGRWKSTVRTNIEIEV